MLQYLLFQFLYGFYNKKMILRRNADLVAFCRGIDSGISWGEGKLSKVQDVPAYTDMVVRYYQKAGDRLIWPHVSP